MTLYFDALSRGYFITSFVEKFKVAISNERLPKLTECSFSENFFTIKEIKSTFIVDLGMKKKRFKSTWLMADWIYRNLAKYQFEDNL